MLGFAPLAAAPLGAPGDGGISYDAAFGDALVITDGGAVARQLFSSAVQDATDITTSTAVTASVFTALLAFAADISDSNSASAGLASAISEASQGSDAAAAAAAFAPRVSESAIGQDSALVEASEFNATATDSSTALDSVRASAIMVSAVSEDAEIDDSDAARYLWTTINNAQSTAWTVVKTQN